MKLPDSFQFRDKADIGFTHSCKRNAYGDYEVKWARGWAERINEVPWCVAHESEVDHWVSGGGWTIVEEKPKQTASTSSLPDEFYVQNCDSGHIYVMKKRYEGVWDIYYKDGVEKAYPNHAYHSDLILNYFKSGTWKILTKPILTTEQQRQVKEFREQIDQLSNSIRIQEQTVEHHTRMIANYRDRQDDLHEKIAELTGEDSPKIVKAKEMKAELDKLKKGNV